MTVRVHFGISRNWKISYSKLVQRQSKRFKQPQLRQQKVLKHESNLKAAADVQLEAAILA